MLGIGAIFKENRKPHPTAAFEWVQVCRGAEALLKHKRLSFAPLAQTRMSAPHGVFHVFRLFAKTEQGSQGREGWRCGECAGVSVELHVAVHV